MSFTSYGIQYWALFMVISQEIGSVIADDDDTDVAHIIQNYRPSFVYSLPLQVLLFTIICALLVVLLVHLAFTASHHYHLAPLNFIFQFWAVIFFLGTHFAMLVMILNDADEQSRQWPYMFSWVAVDIPPRNPPTWPTERVVGWCIARAISSALVQVSHVHLLTTLYPSRFESLLLYFTLGPLVTVSAMTQFLPLIPPQHSDITHIIYATRMATTASLCILFSCLLLFWSTPFFYSSSDDEDDQAVTPGLPPIPKIAVPSSPSGPSSERPQLLKPLHPLAHLFLTSSSLPRARAHIVSKLFSSSAWSRHSGTLALALGTLALSLTNVILSITCVVHAGSRGAVIGTIISSDNNTSNVTLVKEAPWQLALIWTITLWQGYLGWWWWIGAGGGDGVRTAQRRMRGAEKAKARLRQLSMRLKRKPKTDPSISLSRRPMDDSGESAEEEEIVEGESTGLEPVFSSRNVSPSGCDAPARWWNGWSLGSSLRRRRGPGP